MDYYFNYNRGRRPRFLVICPTRELANQVYLTVTQYTLYLVLLMHLCMHTAHVVYTLHMLLPLVL
jgi:superfamily II DNA/RNA helicase